MPYTLTLDKIHINMIEIFRRQVPIETGEMDENGFPIMTNEEEWALCMKYIMQNDQGGRKHGEVIYSMNETHETQIKNFMRPFVQDLKSKIDIQDGEGWSE